MIVKTGVIVGVHLLQVGYTGGTTTNPTTQDVSTGLTGHNEVVRVVFDPAKVKYTDLLKVSNVVAA
jgi:peptide-methionine (S)-S-oxide reductase